GPDGNMVAFIDTDLAQLAAKLSADLHVLGHRLDPARPGNGASRGRDNGMGRGSAPLREAASSEDDDVEAADCDETCGCVNDRSGAGHTVAPCSSRTEGSGSRSVRTRPSSMRTMRSA